MEFYQKYQKPLVPVQDVVTRWWSTFAMLDRMLVLKRVIVVLEQDDQIPTRYKLSMEDWNNFESVRTVLMPMKIAQKILEGSKYITITMVPGLINKIRRDLKQFTEDDKLSDYAKNLAKDMYDDFVERWGVKEKYKSNVQRGSMSRQIGIHPLIYCASFVDPRFKNLKVLEEDDREAVIKDVFDHMMNLDTDDDVYEGHSDDDDDDDDDEGTGSGGGTDCVQNEDSQISMLTEATAFQDNQGNTEEDDFLNSAFGNEDNESSGDDSNDAVTNNFIACRNEIDMYKSEAVLKVKNADGTYNDPLKW